MAKIMIVEDDPGHRANIGRTLCGSGHEVYPAQCSSTALRMASQRLFDVAVIDYGLPGLSGLDVLRKLRDVQPACMRILSTGMFDLPIIIDAVNRGEISRVLAKPFQANDLVRSVESAMRTRQRMLEVIAVQQASARIEQIRQLDECLAPSFIDLALQPIVYASSAEVVGFEALLRSSHPGFDGPLSILRSAETHGRLGDLTDIIFEKAGTWMEILPGKSLLFINLHPRDLEDASKMNARLKVLQPWSDRIVLEITERSRLHDITGWDTTVQMITDQGFQLAIDDLGSGYSSLSMLADLQPHFIKLDMRIIRGIDQDTRKQRLVEMVSRFAEVTDSKLVAEGVETLQEAETLVGCGAHLLQGYFFGRPSVVEQEVFGHMGYGVQQPAV